MKKLVLIPLLLTLPLAWMIWQGESLRRFGTPILLQTAPVDPRSLFQGDYVVLSYDISRLTYDDFNPPTGSLAPKRVLQPNDVIYVVVKEAAPVWRLVYVSYDQPDSLQPDEIPLRGTVTSANGTNIRVKYGIEQYFVKEGTGRAIEGLAWSAPQRLVAKVYVGADGEMGLGDLLVDGVPLSGPERTP